MDGFSRTESLIGKEKIIRIKESSAVVFGLGAVGSYAVEALARMGIGRLRLVDFDILKVTDMNRNLLALRSTLGTPKAVAAGKRVSDINPGCRVEILSVFSGKNEVENVLGAKTDVVIDAIDSLNPKAQLLLFCRRSGIPVVSSMGAALRGDVSRIKTGDLFSVKGCPLAQRLRRRLRGEGIFEGLPCVYSDEPPAKAVFRQDGPAGEYERGRRRNKLGSISTVTGVFGLFLAHLAVESICSVQKKSGGVSVKGNI